MIIYINPDYIQSECCELNKALFKFIDKQDISVEDLNNYISRYPERQTMCHMIYYMSQFVQTDISSFNDWFNFVEKNIDVVANAINYTFIDSFMKKIIYMAVAFKTIDLPNIKYSEFDNFITDKFLEQLIQYEQLETEEAIFSFYIVLSVTIDYVIKKNKFNNISDLLKLIQKRNSLSESYEKIISREYKTLHEEDNNA